MNSEFSKELPKEWDGVSSLFVALGDPQRQRILLTFGKNERLTAGQLASCSTLNRTTVSHHLKILRQAGVLESEKKGVEVFYWINYDRIEGSLNAVLNYIK